MYTRKFLIIVLVVVSCLSFRAIFTSSSLSLGDAPYLSQDLLKTYIHEPRAWTTIGTAFGGMNQFLWIWPYMAVVSISGVVANISSALLVRMFFYVPSVVFAAIGSYFFASRFTKSETTKLIATLVYTVNTYFLLVVDGGQVGIALAYGLFPISQILFSHAVEHYSKRSFILALVGLEIVTLADPRIALISLALSVLLYGRKAKRLVPSILVWIGINMYWIYPLVTNSGSGLSTKIDQFSSFLNGLFLYAPHWSQNIYGVVSYPTVAFVIFPILILLSLKSEKSFKKIFLSWLVFVFLIKGTTEPLGFVYQTLLALPLGAAFRDSTKFFIPALLLGGILVGEGVSHLSRKNSLAVVIFVAIFAFTVLPALRGELSFVLSSRETTQNIESINTLISDSNKTVWVNERDPRGIVTPSESINAFDLASLRPFAYLNVGDHDRLNFLNAPESETWLDVFGIGNIVLNGNPRITNLTQENRRDWDKTVNLINSRSFLNKTSDERVLKNNDPYPLFYGVDKMLFVIGSDTIYQKINDRFPGSVPQKAGVTFVEDGKFEAKDLLEYASESAAIVDNGGGEVALTMSLLKEHFVPTSKASMSQFAQYQSQDYLKYKYELLIRESAFNSFDYDKGIAFSSQPGERIEFTLSAPKGDYILAIRSFSNKNSRFVFNSQPGEIKATEDLVWTTLSVHTNGDQNTLSIENSQGLSVVNVVALIPKDKYVKASQTAQTIMQKLSVYTASNVPKEIFSKGRLPITVTVNGTNRWSVEKSPDAHWLIFTNQFSPKFVYSKDQLSYASVPVFSALNAFYLRPEWSVGTVTFTGQVNLRWGIYFSLITILSLIIFIIYSRTNDN